MHTLKPEKKHEYMIIQKTKGKTVTGSRMKKDKKQRSGNHLKLTPFTHSTQFWNIHAQSKGTHTITD